MATLETWMPHDMKMAERYLAQADQLKNILSNAESKVLTAITDQFTAATMLFGRCELHMRVSERKDALDKDASQKAISELDKQHALRFQSQGLDSLKVAMRHLKDLKKEASEFDQKKIKNQWSEFEKDIKSSWKAALNELDMKPSDATKLQTVMEACSKAGSNGMSGLATFIEEKIIELEKFRNTASRGTEDNWPVWKLAAVAVWLGMTVYGVYNLLVRGAPWWNVAMVILIGLIGTLLIALGC